MTELDTYYAILQVDPAAEPEVIESAYHRLARKYHPDVNNSPAAGERMRVINHAYATLSSPGRRAVYDRERRRPGIRQRLERPTGRPSATRDAGRPAGRGLGLLRYRSVTEPLGKLAASSVAAWAAVWSETLDGVVAGDRRGYERATEAAQRCLTDLSDCLARWEAEVPPPAASRLGELGAACLRLQLALVRGSLSLVEGADYSVLQPLAGLAERINGLTRTIAAEAMLISRAAA